MSTNNAAMATWSTAKAGKEVASGVQAQAQTKRNQERERERERHLSDSGSSSLAGVIRMQMLSKRARIHHARRGEEHLRQLQALWQRLVRLVPQHSDSHALA